MFDMFQTSDTQLISLNKIPVAISDHLEYLNSLKTHLKINVLNRLFINLFLMNINI